MVETEHCSLRGHGTALEQCAAAAAVHVTPCVLTSILPIRTEITAFARKRGFTMHRAAARQSTRAVTHLFPAA